MNDRLLLKDSKPLAQGHSRLVFQHPHNPDWLVKVIRPDVIEDRWGSGTAWYKKRRRFGRYISYVRECQEYIVGCLATGVSAGSFQKVIGFADTDLGLGLVVAAVRGPDGALAPTLADIIRAGRFTGGVQARLEIFQRELLASEVTVSDLNLGNLVYSGGYNKEGDFVLIDGLGTSTLIPFKTLSTAFNRRSKLGRIRRLHQRIARLQQRMQG